MRERQQARKQVRHQIRGTGWGGTGEGGIRAARRWQKFLARAVNRGKMRKEKGWRTWSHEQKADGE